MNVVTLKGPKLTIECITDNLTWLAWFNDTKEALTDICNGIEWHKKVSVNFGD